METVTTDNNTAALTKALSPDVAGDLALMVPTLHHAGVPTAGLSPDGIRAKYRDLQDRQAKDRAEAKARAQEQRRRDLDDQRRQMQAEADRQRADRAARARQFLDERLTDHRGLTDEQAIDAARDLWRRDEEAAEQSARDRERRQRADLLFRAAGGCPARHALNLGQFELDNPRKAHTYDTLAGRPV